MDYKQKYEEALEWARKVIQGKIGFVLDDVLNKFPELKESEDERIRKELITYLKSQGCSAVWNFKDWIAWLEKQGEQKLLNNDKYQTVSVEILDRLYESEKELEQLKQGEHKPADKVEQESTWNEKIKGLSKLEKYIFSLVPDRPLDAIKVDVKNIRYIISKEQNFAWSEEDENRFRNLIYLVEHSNEGKGTKEGFVKFINRLKSLKGRVQPNQEWSEEDERYYDSSLWHIKNSCGIEGNVYNWLKSLKERMKGE